MRVLIAVNANSRRGGEPIDAALAVFERAGFAVRRETVPKSRHIPPILRANAASADCIVLAGGDGTMNAAAETLLEIGLPVGLLPLGTANDLARTLDIPTDLARAAEVIVAGRARPIDLGEVNGRPFFNVANLGLAVALKRELKRAAKGRWGRFAYAVAGLRALGKLHPFEAEIVGDGQRLTTRTIQIGVGNGRHYGGFATVAEDAFIDDGQLHLYSIETRSLARLLAMYPAFLRGRHGAWGDVRTLTGTEFEIRTERPMDVSADGKLVTQTPARITLRRHALNVFAPAEAAELRAGALPPSPLVGGGAGEAGG